MSEFADKVRAIEAVLDKSNQALADALNAEKTTRASCTCGRKFDVLIKDHRTAVDAAKAQYAIVGDLMKHLEKLRGETHDLDHTRPLRDWTTEQLVTRYKELGGTWPITKAA